MGDSFWSNLLKSLLSIFISEETEKKGKLKPMTASISIPIDKPKNESQEEPSIEDKLEIDWTDPSAKLSKYFTVKEVLWLPSWQAMHIPSEEDKVNILKQAKKMDMIREFLGVPLSVHCWIRPILNCPSSIHDKEDYNAFIKGARNSAHKVGKATDWSPIGITCEQSRQKLEPKLEEFGIRMENNGEFANWTHTDCADLKPGGHRFFIP